MSSATLAENPKNNTPSASSESEESDASYERSENGSEKINNKIGSAVVVKGNTEPVDRCKDNSRHSSGSRSNSRSKSRSRSRDRGRRYKRRRSEGEDCDKYENSGSESEFRERRKRSSYDRNDKDRRDRRERGQRRRNEGYWNAYAPSDRYYGENRGKNWGRSREWRDNRGWKDAGWSRDGDRNRNRGRYYEEEQERGRYRDRDQRTSRRRERSPSEDKENSQKKTKSDREELKEMPTGVQERVKGSNGRDAVNQKDTPATNVATEQPQKQPEVQKKAVDILTTKTGGAYIPPARLKMMQKEITDKSSIAYQRLSWEALKKSIHGLINRVNTSNIAVISVKLMSENIVRGRGLLCRSLMQAQAASPTFSNVFATLISIINTRFPATVELLIQRLVVQFRRSFRRNDKTTCINTTTFLAHLINMDVVHEILALEILTLLVENPTDHSIEVAISFLKECGPKIQEVSAAGLAAVFDSLRHILHEGQLDKRVQYMIEVMFQMRKEFHKKQIIPDELDLVDQNDVRTHVITLEDAVDPQDILNVFKNDPNFVENEEKYQALKKVIVGDFSDASDSENEGSDDDDDDEEEDGEGNEKEGEGSNAEIIDNTETNLVSLRRTIYLTITSSLDFEECAHKLSCLQLRPGQEPELCHMFLDCCSQQRTYEKFYGLLAQRFCQMRKVCVGAFEQIFKDSYETIHRLETNKLRNVAKFFAHLLFTDAISWDVLGIIQLDMEHTNPSSRIFVKILFQELSEYMGLQKLNERVKDPTLQSAFEGLFPRHDPKDTRFAINFFTSIGLGGLTDELREHLKNQPKVQTLAEALTLNSSSSSTSSSSSSSSSDTSSDSDSSSDSSSSPASSSSSDDSSDSEDNSKRKSSKKKANVKKKKKGSVKKSSSKKDTPKQPKKKSNSKERRKEKSKNKK